MVASSSFLFILFFLLSPLQSSPGSLPPPQTSFLLDSVGRPLVHFSLPDISNTTMLLLSSDASTLYVGARDAVLSLDVSRSDVISLKTKVQWSPSADDISSCSSKGKSPTGDCANFVHVLQQVNSTHLYACGSFAFSPREVYIDTESLSLVHHGGAKGRCAFSPFERTAAITIDGELFTATTTDFRGVKPQISRYFSKDGRPDVSLDSSVSLLEDPSFVGSSLDQAEKKLYFFFSEIGKEFSFLDELQISRVSQVCKDDVGGQRTLQRKWTSFAKAPLLCQSPKQLPFNILQDVFTLQPPEGGAAADTLFYGVFTSQWSTGPRSAVCVFRLQDFRTVFSGSYRTFDMQSHQWSPLVEKHSFLGQCGLANSSDSDLGEVKRSFLTSGSVQSTGNGPIVVSAEQQYSRVTVMRTRAVDGNQYTILFLLTESGFIHKVVLFERGPWVIEEIQVFREPQRVKNIVLSLSKGLLYVGTSEGVTAVPVANCSIYRTCSQCVLARDPMCGWSQAGSFCTEVHGSPENIVQRLEGGGMEEICEPETRTVKTVSVHLHKFVRLQCQKPSNTASLTWTSDRFQRLPENLFIQSADGSIQFLATSDTFGTYHCEAEEVGFKQVIVSYDVQQTASPRSSPKVEEGLTDESYENIFTNAPVTYVVPSSEVSEVSEVHEDDDKVQKVTTNIFHRSENNNPSDLTSTSHRGTQSQPEPGDRKEKSYFSELVAVSCLLVLCICALMIAALYVWQQRQADRKSDRLVCPEEGSKNNNCPESCSLSSPEDPGPDLKVVE
ncbi:semaphorin-4B isoform X1 [Parambassis ranga]|uniref:Semaphorin-4B isoform X1 n=1 Tax=Parambassis ranga TaxID=210632 RepID=A0A6P7HGL2_9TELE|nr:semaphorin-4B-like isoform X1 [Parambassis ranga]